MSSSTEPSVDHPPERPTGVSNADTCVRQEATAKAVIDCTLERKLWTHEEHLRFAAGVVRLHGREASMDISRTAIRRYNEASGCANTETNGYHETLTAYYCAAVAHVLEHPSADARLEDEPLLAREAPMQYWDRDTLFSVTARLAWVPPTLPLPFAVPFALPPTWPEPRRHG